MKTGFDFCRIGGENYVTIELADSRRDETAERVLERDWPGFMLELSVVEINERVQFRYRMNRGVSLANLQDGLTAGQFLTVLKNLLQALKNCSDWFLDYHNFCLDPHVIFVDRDTMDVALVYLPLAEEVMGEEEMKEFFQSLILGTRLAGNAGDLQISLLQYLNGGAYSLSGLLELVSGYGSRMQQPAYGDHGVRQSGQPQPVSMGRSGAAPGASQAGPSSYGYGKAVSQPGAGQTAGGAMAGRPGAPAGAGPASAVTGQPSTAQPAARQAGAVFGRTPSQPASGPAAQQPSSGEEEDGWLNQLMDADAKKPVKKERHFGLFGGKKEKPEKAEKPEKPDKKEKKEKVSRRDKRKQKEIMPEEPAPSVVFAGQPQSYEIPQSPMDLDEGTDIGGSSSPEPHLELCSAAISSPPPFIPLQMGPAGMSIGRKNSKNIISDYMFPAEIRGVSKQQARIFMEGGVYYLCDLNSSSGTFVNGERCIPNKAYRLNAGDLVTFSEKYQLVYQVIL